MFASFKVRGHSSVLKNFSKASIVSSADATPNKSKPNAAMRSGIFFFF